MITPLIDQRCTLLGLTVLPPKDTMRTHWECTHVWLTVDGNWDDVPRWAKEFQSDKLGGSTHLFMLGRRIDGSLAESKDLFILGWPGQIHKFDPEQGNGWWGNAFISAGFDWGKTPGPYYGQMNALSTSVVEGIGLPYPPLPWQAGEANVMGGVHVSWFVVMQEVAAYEPEPEPEPQPPDIERFIRVLDKAEKLADRLTESDTERVAALQTYLAIAALVK